MQESSWSQALTEIVQTAVAAFVRFWKQDMVQVLLTVGMFLAAAHRGHGPGRAARGAAALVPGRHGLAAVQWFLHHRQGAGVAAAGSNAHGGKVS